MRRQNFLELGSDAASPPALATVAGWNGVALQVMHAAGPAPAPAYIADSLAILHTCMYNAWAAYDDDARQTPRGFAVRLPRAERSAASKACAMSHAACLALAARFPAQRAIVDAHAARLGLDPGPAGMLSPAGIGRTQAGCVLDTCKAEGDAQGGACAAGPSPADWCRLAHDLSARAGFDDDRDVLLYFVLGNALADATAAAGAGRAGAAAAEALRCFTGEACWLAGAVPDDWGKKIGALVFERARRYWQGLA